MSVRIALLLLTLVLPAAAQAQLFRAYLAPDGSDANPCTLAQPCRLLPAALTAVASGGEIWMLDSANYNTGTVNIGKSVSILAVPGVVGSFVTTGVPALTITADSLKVSLRNLVIVPLSGASGSGVVMTGASELFIEETTIANIISGQYGVLVDGTGSVRIANSTFRNIGGFAVAVAGSARVSVSSSRFLGGVTAVGVQSTGAGKVIVSDTAFQGAQNALVAIATSGGANVAITASRCTIEGAANALYVDGLGGGVAEIAIAGNTITQSTTPWFIGGTGVIRSFGNNQFVYTGSPVGALTSIAAQ